MPPNLLDNDDWLTPGFEAILSEVFACFDADHDGQPCRQISSTMTTA